MNDLVKHRWVRIMPDFCAEGVWDKNGSCANATDLPVNNDIQLGLMKWNYDFDVWADIPADEWFTKDQIEELSRRGRRLAVEIKEALPDWTVIYHDIARHKTKFDFEYEVKCINDGD